MAGIDKTYGANNQWSQANDFLKNSKVQMELELDNPISMYLDFEEVDENPLGKERIPIWNTTPIQDIWLAKNCQFDFVQNRLKEQYDKSFFDFAEYVDFSINYVTIERIKSKGSDKIDLGFYYFPNPEPDETCYGLEPSDSILVYGTTFFAKVIHVAKRLVSRYTSFLDEFDDLEVYVCYFGANLIFTKDIVFIELQDGTKMQTHFIPCIFEEDIELPWIVHSYNSNDAKSTTIPSPQLIYISSEDSIHALSTYKQVTEHDWEFIQKGLKYGRFDIPKYIQELLK